MFDFCCVSLIFDSHVWLVHYIKMFFAHKVSCPPGYDKNCCAIGVGLLFFFFSFDLFFLQESGMPSTSRISTFVQGDIEKRFGVYIWYRFTQPFILYKNIMIHNSSLYHNNKVICKSYHGVLFNIWLSECIVCHEQDGYSW